VGFVVFPFLYWFYFFPYLDLFLYDGGCIAAIEGVGNGSLVWFEQDRFSSCISVSTVNDSWHRSMGGNMNV